MGKKQNRPPASNTAAASTTTGNKSSILRASFSPSKFQLTLFASVIQGLDAQHLRVHDTITGKLQCDLPLAPKESVTSLDWGYFPTKSKEHPKKKRKRHSDVNGATAHGLDQGDAVIAIGTNRSDIRMYSPSMDKVVTTLSGAHDKGIKDFKFTDKKPGQEGWSIGDDNKLVQWDLHTGQSIRTINLPASSYTTLSRPLPSNPPVICASQAPHIIDIENADQVQSFPAMRNPIHTILSSAAESVTGGLFLASDSDRYMNVFDPTSQRLVMNLVAENEVSSLSFYSGPEKKSDGSAMLEKQALAVVTNDGSVEFFSRPFFQPGTGSKGASLKAKSKQMTRRADATLQFTRSEESDSLVPVVTATFQGPELIVAWVEGGVIPVFERIKWLNEETEELLFTGTKKVAKTKSSAAINAVTTNGTKSATETQVDETKAMVEQGNFADDDVEMQDSRQEAESDSADSDDDEPKQQQQKESKKKDTDNDVEMQSAAESDQEEEKEDEEGQGGEPSFGELLRANANEEVDVEAELEDDTRMGPLVPGKSAAVQQIPTGVSLSTVLTQALKTNDSAMLESCFHTSDLSIIRSTIQRLDSSLAATLLQRLAERLSSRPGRYGHLLIWVQWTCVAHGGALAGKPDLLKRMATLFKVMDQRSSSLPSLLLLKGKLDMLDAQLGLRQSIRSGADADSEDEENVIYVEGQEDSDSDASDAEPKPEAATPRSKSIRDHAFDEDESMMNGIQESDNDEVDVSEEEEDDDNENSNIFDVEAEESAGSSDAEESLEENEDEDEDEDDGSMADFVAGSEDEEEESDAAAPQPPPSKKAKQQQKQPAKGKNKSRR